MRRSPRVLLAWAAALIVMLLTVRVVAADLGSLHRRARSLGPDVTVVVAARDLPLGSPVAARDLRTVRRPSTTVSPDALHDPGAAVGQLIAVALLRGDVVGARHLTDRDGGVVPEGRRGVHVVVKDGFDPPIGSVVDVFAAFDPALETGAGGTPTDQAAVVARGARVLAPTGGTVAADATGAQGITLLVTEAEARAVAFASSIGEVSLALAPVSSACCAATAS